MKKVLALVLAVIMVCTIAMAAPVSVVVTPIGGASADGQIKLCLLYTSPPDTSIRSAAMLRWALAACGPRAIEFPAYP